MSERTTWRKMISDEMSRCGDAWSDVESCTLTDAQLDVEFDSGFGISKGEPFTVWTTKRVYFPAVYDGSEWADSVSRHPDGKATTHVGGQ